MDINPTVAGILVTGVIGVAGFVIGNNRNESKARGRIYGRIDEKEEQYNKTFQRKDVCDVIHKTTTDTLNEIKQDVKKLLTKNGLK